jgi:hypothetical protein
MPARHAPESRPGMGRNPQIDPYATAPTGVHHFSAWDGMLTGLYLRR